MISSRKLLLTLALISKAVYSQSTAPFSSKVTLSPEKGGRGLAEIIDRVQRKFMNPITYEELPFESPAELTSVTLVYEEGPRVISIAPSTDFTVTLDKTASTPYLAA